MVGWSRVDMPVGCLSGGYRSSFRRSVWVAVKFVNSVHCPHLQLVQKSSEVFGVLSARKCLPHFGGLGLGAPQLIPLWFVKGFPRKKALLLTPRCLA